MKLVVLIVALLSTSGMAKPSASSPELIEMGKKLFETNCSVCHGSGGKGDGAAAAALNPKPRNFVTEPFKNGASPDQIFNTVANGLKGTNMQGFPSLTEDQRWGVVYYVLSLKQK